MPATLISRYVCRLLLASASTCPLSTHLLACHDVHAGHVILSLKSRSREREYEHQQHRLHIIVVTFGNRQHTVNEYHGDKKKRISRQHQHAFVLGGGEDVMGYTNRNGTFHAGVSQRHWLKPWHSLNQSPSDVQSQCLTYKRLF